MYLKVIVFYNSFSAHENFVFVEATRRVALQEVFIMRYINLFVGFLLLYANCSPESEFKIPDSGPVLSDVLTHVLTIGGEEEIYEKSQEDFLLANPRFNCIAVNNANDIFVFDEARVKVYDENGKPKRIIGGPGEGPGEFDARSIISICVGPTGYLTVGERDVLNIFSPDGKFLEQNNYQLYKPYEHIFTDLNLRSGMPRTFQALLVALNDTDRILLIEGSKMDGRLSPSFAL